MRRLELVLVDDGAELRDLDDDGKVLWASDADEDFLEEFPDMLSESDLHDIVDFLLDTEMVTEAEADHMEVWEEGADDSEDMGRSDFDPDDETEDD